MGQYLNGVAAGHATKPRRFRFSSRANVSAGAETTSTPFLWRARGLIRDRWFSVIFTGECPSR